MINYDQLLWLSVEAFLLGAILYLLLRLRPWLGNVPLYVTVGSFQFIQVVLAMSVYVEVASGLSVSPGSSVLFTGTILSVLLVYILDDADGARRFIYSILIANVILSLVTYAISLHMISNDTSMLIDIPVDVFRQNPRVLLVGTFTLFIDTILVIVLYEFLAKIKSLFLRMTLALSGVLVFDSVVFVTGSFFEQVDYAAMLVSSIIGKLILVPPATCAVAVMHHLFKSDAQKDSSNISDFFNLLTYRQKYELAKSDSLVDPLTRLYNRRAFDNAFRGWIDIGDYAILMIDADNFKIINDELGHSKGDEVIQLISSAITTQLRGSDVAYRYGGEEFLVFLPYTNTDEAVLIGGRIRQALEVGFSQSPLPDGHHVTLSVGVASAPIDGKYGKEIIDQADQRLYQAKNNGKNQIVSENL